MGGGRFRVFIWSMLRSQMPSLDSRSYVPNWQKPLLIWDASVFRQPEVRSRSCLLLEQLSLSEGRRDSVFWAT